MKNLTLPGVTDLINLPEWMNLQKAYEFLPVGLTLVVRSLLSVSESSVNRPTEVVASGARGRPKIVKGQHESHH